jgi:hypothetical protein
MLVQTAADDGLVLAVHLGCFAARRPAAQAQIVEPMTRMRTRTARTRANATDRPGLLERLQEAGHRSKLARASA